jgi:hypothetical protein
MKKLMVLCMFFLMSGVVFAQSNIPVTRLTLNMLIQLRNSGENIGELQFFISEAMRMLVIDEHNSVPEVTIKNKTLAFTNQDQYPEITINKNDEGKMIYFPATNTDIIEIVFQANGSLVPVKFRWNAQKNNYIAFAATINTKSYNLHSQTELPHLFIRSDIGTDADDIYAVIPSAVSMQTQVSRSMPVLRQTAYLPQHTGISRYILGTGSLTKASIIEYVRYQNPAASRVIGPLIDIYFEEARFERINHDIAIAQMLHATNSLGNERMTTHNYAGLLPTREWNGRFPYRMNSNGMTEGVRAHIQHLKGYASNELNRPLVDPRYEILQQLNYIGRVRTFDELYSVWTADPSGYRDSIERILQGLYFYSR